MSAALAYQFEGYASFGAANDNTPLPSAAAIIKMTPVGAATYRYDALGNLREKRFNKHGAIRTVTNNYNSRNRIISSIDTANIGYGFNYDTRGNIRTAGLLNFTYDMSDQPVTMNGRAPNTGTQVDANYLYDNHLNAAPHSGVSENACKHMRVYLPWALLAQGAPPPSNRWRATPRLHGMGQTLARIKNGVFTYLAPAGAFSALNHSPRMIYSAISEPSPKPDHLGSPVTGTTETGTVAFTERYTPYGEALLSPAANDNHSGFTGHIKDKSTGLNYMQARYYDPNIGRFLSIDPQTMMSQNYDPRFFNRYAYTFNDPVNLTDPHGECPWCIGAAYGAIAGAVGAYIASDGDWKSVAVGALAGGAVGAVNPLAANAVGAAIGTSATGTAAVAISGGALGAAASATGQIAGGVMQGQSLGEAASNIDGGAVVGAGLGGAVAPAVQGAIVARVTTTKPWLAGSAATASTFGDNAIGSAVAGAIAGTSELAGDAVTPQSGLINSLPAPSMPTPPPPSCEDCVGQ